MQFNNLKHHPNGIPNFNLLISPFLVFKRLPHHEADNHGERFGDLQTFSKLNEFVRVARIKSEFVDRYQNLDSNEQDAQESRSMFEIREHQTKNSEELLVLQVRLDLSE